MHLLFCGVFSFGKRSRGAPLHLITRANSVPNWELFLKIAVNTCQFKGYKNQAIPPKITPRPTDIAKSNKACIVLKQSGLFCKRAFWYFRFRIHKTVAIGRHLAWIGVHRERPKYPQSAPRVFLPNDQIPTISQAGPEPYGDDFGAALKHPFLVHFG